MHGSPESPIARHTNVVLWWLLVCAVLGSFSLGSTAARAAALGGASTSGLSVDLTDSADPVVVGEKVIFALSATNATGLTLPQAYVHASVPSDMTFVSADPECHVSPSDPGYPYNVRCAIGELRNGVSVTYHTSSFRPRTSGSRHCPPTRATTARTARTSEPIRARPRRQR